VIDAQAKAAVSTVNFVNTMGFTAISEVSSEKQAVMVDFSYETTNKTTGAIMTNTLSVPLLSMVPIPFIRVKSAVIQFNAKISSVSKSEVATSTSISTQLSSGANVILASASMTASFSSQVSTNNSNEQKREYSMMVRVEAVQDEMPGGLAKVLSILEEAILKGIRNK
jgi:Protein of unknown function (DUF2589)